MAGMAGETKVDIKSCRQLVAEYKDRRKALGYHPLATILEFDQTERVSSSDLAEVPELTVYNITRPFGQPNKRFLAGRAESRHSELDSRIVFFEEEVHDHRWKPIKDAPVLPLQDPFYIEDVQGYQIVGGVHIWDDASRPGGLNWCTYFYRYKQNLAELVGKNGKLKPPFAIGPDGMKDIRLIELPSGRIGVFTRPQSSTPSTGGRGKIGYLEIDHLDQLTPERIAAAPLLPGLFRDEEWGGANELHLLKNGRVGVLGHIAEFTGKQKNYYPMTFCFDPVTKAASGLKIIALSDSFPRRVGTKTPELNNVMFSGGLIRLPHQDALLYAGVGDIAAGVVYLDEDPFLEYEA